MSFDFIKHFHYLFFHLHVHVHAIYFLFYMYISYFVIVLLVTLVTHQLQTHFLPLKGIFSGQNLNGEAPGLNMAHYIVKTISLKGHVMSLIQCF